MPKESIEPLTVRQLQDASQTLAELSKLLQQAIPDVKASGRPLYVFRCSSLRRAVERLAAFRVALSQSLMALHAGKPLGPDAQKNPKK